jgi:hypothetical protein
MTYQRHLGHQWAIGDSGLGANGRLAPKRAASKGHRLHGRSALREIGAGRGVRRRREGPAASWVRRTLPLCLSDPASTADPASAAEQAHDSGGDHSERPAAQPGEIHPGYRQRARLRYLHHLVRLRHGRRRPVHPVVPGMVLWRTLMMWRTMVVALAVVRRRLVVALAVVRRLVVRRATSCRLAQHRYRVAAQVDRYRDRQRNLVPAANAARPRGRALVRQTTRCGGAPARRGTRARSALARRVGDPQDRHGVPAEIDRDRDGE